MKIQQIAANFMQLLRAKALKAHCDIYCFLALQGCEVNVQRRGPDTEVK